MPNILLVEDDTALAELISSYLERNGYSVSVIGRGDHVRERARVNPPDLVILDLMLPGLDGLQVCRLLRADSATLPILMLTARDDSHDQVLGLEMGADDYVTKPCEPRVLLARVRTLLRRSSLGEPLTVNDRIVMGNLCIDLSERTVTWRDQPVELSSGEYNLLVVLARHAGEVLSRDQILQRLRGIEFNGTDRSVDVAISSCAASSTTTLARHARSKPCGAKAICSVVQSGNAELMFRILFRLYLVTIVSYSAAIYLVPDLVVMAFRDRFVTYNLDYSRGLQSLITRQFHAVPQAQWPALAASMDKDFQPLHIVLARIDDAEFTAIEQERLRRGENVVRIGDWGWRTLAVTPLDDISAVQMVVPPDPMDVNLLYWSINVLVGATLLACLLMWLRPHWRDLERLKGTAERFGKGHLSERTEIAPSSNIGSLANVFDTMAGDIENLLNQQRDLLNAVSHELRTPLTRLDFGLALALSDDLPAASRERLLGLVAHIRELDELVLELLSYSRLQNPAQTPEQVEVSLDEFIDSILGSVDEELESPEIVIDVLLHGQLERFSLDPRLTARAIQNLLRNAMRYCEKRIQIGVQVNAEGCEIWVDDDGIGIPDDERERIFEPFYRLDRSRDRATGGFGLGLAISRRALEAQGGTLTVESSPLGGARFRLWLPTTV